MIVFRTEKEFLPFAVEAPRITPSFSARCTIGIALSASQCSERSWIVVGFVFSSPQNFATYVFTTSNLLPLLCGLPNSKEAAPSLHPKSCYFLVEGQRQQHIVLCFDG